MHTYTYHKVCGYYDYGYATKTVTKRLELCPYGSCGVVIDYPAPFSDETIELWSYDTMVISIREGRLECTGTYSATTRKHIGCFMREYTKYTYQDAKFCYENDAYLDLETGGFVSLKTGEVLRTA